MFSGVYSATVFLRKMGRPSERGKSEDLPDVVNFKAFGKKSWKPDGINQLFSPPNL
jgi:hypothetical protein